MLPRKMNVHGSPRMGLSKFDVVSRKRKIVCYVGLILLLIGLVGLLYLTVTGDDSDDTQIEQVDQ